MLAGAFASQRGNLFGLYDLFVGGAFSRATIFALGIMPYISSSIILQLLGAVVPYFEKLRKEGEEGQKKLTQLTRYGTVLISVLQSFASLWLLPRLAAFKQARPDLDVEIDTSAELMDLTDERYDAAIRFGTGRWPGLAELPAGQQVELEHLGLGPVGQEGQR